ncbi:MAG: hypothetical protein LBU51_05940 [Bacteroidales bacterium]|jgi:hypothetical protein|nr:hypothetical protein [Bacteroidales bacterium]
MKENIDDMLEKTEPVLNNEELDEMDDEDSEGGYSAYFNPKRSSLMLVGHREKKQLMYEHIVSKIKCYVVESSDNQFYIDKIRFDHPEPVAQIKKVVMTLNKSISHHTCFLAKPVDDSHTIYEQVGYGLKYHLAKAPNYHQEGYYLEKISLERPINLNMFRSTTIGCTFSSGRAVFRARDAAILVHKDGDKVMSELAFQICGDKELAEEAVEMAHTYLNTHPDVVARLERMYERQAEKLSFFQKWFHL